MNELLRDFFISFVPLFVAIDIIALVPLFLSFTENIEKTEKQTLIHQACATVLVVSLIFLIMGRALFTLMGITSGDFQVGGGLLLLIISINDLVRPDEVIQRRSSEHIGVVPIGIPLILGPAALTTLLVNSESLGFRVTFLALLFNLIIVWTVLMNSHLVLRILKAGGIKAIAKVAALFLAAIGVRMIRSGLTELKIF